MEDEEESAENGEGEAGELAIGSPDRADADGDDIRSSDSSAARARRALMPAEESIRGSPMRVYRKFQIIMIKK